jgi:hypothetical protein
MRLAWATDVHLNFLSEPAVRAFCQRLTEHAPDAILLSGDIAEARSLERWLRFVLDEVQRPVWFVLGNHDFYGGSLAQVRALAASLCAAEPRLRWLSTCAPITLSPGVALVGQDGWGDGRLGTPERSPVLLNDWRLIKELTGLYGESLRARLRALGEEEAAALRPRLEAALAAHRTVLVAVHVPPFRDACWHAGRISDDNWLPWFTCHAVGEVLLAAAERHRDRSLVVLCGHTHGSGVAHVRPNLLVHTGGAEYGDPQLAGLWLADNGALRRLPV